MMKTTMPEMHRPATIALAAWCLACFTAIVTAGAEPADKQLAEEIRLSHEWAATTFSQPQAAVRHHTVFAHADTLIVLRKSHQVLTNCTTMNPIPARA